MSVEMEFYIKLLITFVISGIGIYIMHITQKRKEEEAERKFQQTLQMIELRNRKYVPKGGDNEPKG